MSILHIAIYRGRLKLELSLCVCLMFYNVLVCLNVRRELIMVVSGSVHVHLHNVLIWE